MFFETLLKVESNVVPPPSPAAACQHALRVAAEEIALKINRRGANVDKQNKRGKVAEGESEA